MEWRIKVPARLELVGPSQAGKSTLILKLVGDDSVWETPIRRVIFAAPVLTDRQEYLAQLEKVCSRTGKVFKAVDQVPRVEDIKEFAAGQPSLLVVDDLLGFEDTRPLSELATCFSHHANITTVYAYQNPFYRNSKLDLTTLTRNLTGRFILYQVNDYFVYRLINSRLFPERPNFLVNCLEQAKHKYGLPYVFINVHCFSGLPRRYICQTAIFADERKGDDSPVFFDLEDRVRKRADTVRSGTAAEINT